MAELQINTEPAVGNAADRVLPFPVVGIVGSAGSRQPLETLFRHLPDDSGLAFIIVVRLVVHPEQFVVLSSESPTVVENSIKHLAMQGWIMDLLDQPRSPWALMEIHGGKRGGTERLVRVIEQLPPAIRTRLCLENDENAYSAQEILAVCQAAGVPMVFDAHHHICKEKLDSYEHPSVAAMVAAARTTWPDPTWQVVHLSNGRDHFGHRSHSDLISAVPRAYNRVQWVEVEAKHKEAAISQLHGIWPA